MVFHALSKGEIKKIVELMIGELQERLKEQGLEIEATEKQRTSL